MTMMTILLEIIVTDGFPSLGSMDASPREATSSLLRTRAVILTNTATTATINTSTTKRGTITMTRCAITRSQRIRFPRIREEGATLKSR